MTALVAAIPPPPFSSFQIGPVTIRMYGILIGLGVLAAVWLCGRLMEERQIGDVDDAASIAVWGVFAGIIGARFYHVVTDFQNYRGDNFINAFKIWTPGLGIPGGILFGTIAGIWAAKRRGIPVLPALSCAAPAIPLAQAIGRFGNYFNQELFGRPTTLPWGLELSPNISTSYPPGTLFHPTFLYESIWNVLLCLGLVWLFHHRPRLQPGRLFPLYMIGYGLGRLWIESLRIDPANKIGPFRTNIWMSLLLITAGAAWFIVSRNSDARWPHPLRAVGATATDAETTEDRDETKHDGDDKVGAGRQTPSDSDTDDADDGDVDAGDRDSDSDGQPEKKTDAVRSTRPQAKRGSRSHGSRVDPQPETASGESSDATTEAPGGDVDDKATPPSEPATAKQTAVKKATRKTAKPDKTPDSAKPDSGKPDSAKPDSAKPDSGKPDSAKPDSAKAAGPDKKADSVPKKKAAPKKAASTKSTTRKRPAQASSQNEPTAKRSAGRRSSQSGAPEDEPPETKAAGRDTSPVDAESDASEPSAALLDPGLAAARRAAASDDASDRSADVGLDIDVDVDVDEG